MTQTQTPDMARFSDRQLDAIVRGGGAAGEAADDERYNRAAGDEPQSCSMCDGYGHGYPGAGPCPLEDRGEQGVPWWAQ